MGIIIKETGNIPSTSSESIKNEIEVVSKKQVSGRTTRNHILQTEFRSRVPKNSPLASKYIFLNRMEICRLRSIVKIKTGIRLFGVTKAR